ncbi:hypothetical protein [Phaffia rhodozyma]|uniref:Uncharacterized protein n=1 Tax=Phaffia rhodozyma TaxID=264483 RepID=A0A0F7SSU1_PHARH|nr:hypothetical protein [Phaffia rhodozyma]
MEEQSESPSTESPEVSSGIFSDIINSVFEPGVNSLALWGSTAWFVNELLIVQAQQKASSPSDEKDATTASITAVELENPLASSTIPSEPQSEPKKKR